jgi:hypothetical protein
MGYVSQIAVSGCHVGRIRVEGKGCPVHADGLLPLSPAVMGKSDVAVGRCVFGVEGNAVPIGLDRLIVPVCLWRGSSLIEVLLGCFSLLEQSAEGLPLDGEGYLLARPDQEWVVEAERHQFGAGYPGL